MQPRFDRVRFGWFLALAWTGLFLGSCRTVRLQPTEVSSEAVLLTVPMVAQDELYECGLASISALALYHETELSDEARADLVRLASLEEGLSGEDLRKALEASGMEVFIFPGTLDHQVSGVYYHIDRGRPLLVMLSVSDGTYHYALFTGYDPVNQNVFLLDPRRGRLSLLALSFDALWTKSDRFSLLATAMEPSPNSPTASPR